MRVADEPFSKAMLIRLFRLWAMAREDGAFGLAPMYAVSCQLRLPDEAAPACASLFELIEAALERPLVRECCCANTCSPDEIALLGVVEAAPSLDTMRGSAAIPQGLPGSIRWAALTVRRALQWPACAVQPRGMARDYERFPFETARREPRSIGDLPMGLPSNPSRHSS